MQMRTWTVAILSCLVAGQALAQALEPTAQPVDDAAKAPAVDAVGAETSPPVDSQAAVEAAPTDAAPAAESPPPVVEPGPPAADAAADARFLALEQRLEELETQAALADLQAGEDDAAVSVNDSTLNLYGFMDFGLDKFFLSGERDDDLGILRPTDASSFVFGNLNLYVDATMGPHWQSLFELRFTTAPHGEELDLAPPIGTSYKREDTTAFDFASPSAQSQLRLGSVFIERAWTEWKYANWLRVRAGLFLNPFGIWNVDHGSPTLIALMLPTFVAGQMMPGRLLGVQWLGSTSSGPWTLEYFAHVSNGRTPLEFDLSDDKGIGGRLALSWDGDGQRATVGVSSFYGTFEDIRKEINVEDATSAGQGFFDWNTFYAYDEYVWGADLAYDLGPVRFRSEGVARWVYYEEGKRQPVFNTNGDPRYTPDRLEWDFYGLAAYRTPWSIEPYVMAEAAHKSFLLPKFGGEVRDTSADALAIAYSAGLNIRLTPRVQLKSQFAFLRLFTIENMKHQWDVPIVYTRLVSSF